jgi:hypothetical protein
MKLLRRKPCMPARPAITATSVEIVALPIFWMPQVSKAHDGRELTRRRSPRSRNYENTRMKCQSFFVGRTAGMLKEGSGVEGNEDATPHCSGG